MRVGIGLSAFLQLPPAASATLVQQVVGGKTFSEPYADARAANARVRQLLAIQPSFSQSGHYYLRAVRAYDNFLLGQWIVSNGAWCHQGGTWKSGVPNCTGAMPPAPTYPSAPYLGAPPLPGGYGARFRGGWW